MKKIFTILLVFLTLTSCLGTKKVTESNTSFSQSSEVRDLLDSKIETSEAIKDEITINVPESSNPEVTKELIGLIKRMETSKTSGGNGYKFYYDEKLKALKLEIEIAKTQNTDVAKVKETKTESTFEESLDKYVRKFVIPWWAYIVGLFFIRKEIFWILKQIFPALRAFSIFKPRNPKTEEEISWGFVPKPNWRRGVSEPNRLNWEVEVRNKAREMVEDLESKNAKKRQEWEAKETKRLYDEAKELEYQKHVEKALLLMDREKLANFGVSDDFLTEQAKNIVAIEDIIDAKRILSPEDKRWIEDILASKGIFKSDNIKEE